MSMNKFTLLLNKASDWSKVVTLLAICNQNILVRSLFYHFYDICCWLYFYEIVEIDLQGILKSILLSFASLQNRINLRLQNANAD